MIYVRIACKMIREALPPNLPGYGIGILWRGQGYINRMCMLTNSVEYMFTLRTLYAILFP
jgi:hypothetical protein